MALSRQYSMRIGKALYQQKVNYIVDDQYIVYESCNQWRSLFRISKRGQMFAGH